MDQHMLKARIRVRRLLRPFGAGSLMCSGTILVAIAAVGVSSTEFGGKTTSAGLQDQNTSDYSLLTPTLESTLCPLHEDTAVSQPLFPAVNPDNSQAGGHGERLRPLRMNDPVGGSIYLCPRPVMRG